MAFLRGVEAYRTGDYDDALRLLTQAIGEDDELIKALDTRAATFERLGRPKDALADARELCRLRPALPRGWSRAGKVYVSLGQLDKARKVLEAGIAQVSSDRAAVLHNQLEGVASEIEHQVGGPVDHTAHLPDELLIAVMLTLPIHERVRCTHVSQRWRRVVIGSPAVWQTLALRMVRWTPKLESKITTWLQRLQQQPLLHLEIAVADGHVRVAERWEALRSVFEAVPLATLRTLSCDLGHENWDRAGRMWHQTFPQMPLLVALQITAYPWDSKAAYDRLIAALPMLRQLYLQGRGTVDAPSLWRLDVEILSRRSGLEILHLHSEVPLHGVGYPDVPEPVDIDLRWLRELRVGLIDVPLAQQLVTSPLPMLERLEVGMMPLVYALPEQNAIVHPRVKHVKMRKDALKLFRHLSLPALEDLTLERTSAPVASDYARLAQDSPRVRRLSILQCAATDEHLVGPLGTWARSLVELRVPSSTISNASLEALVTNGMVAGQLERLDISHCTLVTGRPVMQLAPKHLIANGCSGIDPQAIKWLRKQGCRVECKFQLPEAETKRWANRRQ